MPPATVPAIDIAFDSRQSSIADEVSVAIHDLQPVAVQETGDAGRETWRVFFRSDTARDEALAFLRQQPMDVTLTPVDVDDENWAARSQAALRAVRVGRIVVAPPWDVPATAGDDLVIVIEPSMGFGTGHHESTRLCLELLQTLDLAGARVLDVGTGSGVLAIAALRLGAAGAHGIDFDPDAIACARENAERNGCADRAGFTTEDLRQGDDVADVVLANLTGGLLVAAANSLTARVAPGGRLVISGFQRHEAHLVLEAFASGFAVLERRVEEGWEAAVLRGQDD